MNEQPDQTLRHQAIAVQLSIAQMDKIQVTLNLVNTLCERITGIPCQMPTPEWKASEPKQEPKQEDTSNDIPKRNNNRPIQTKAFALPKKRQKGDRTQQKARNAEVRRRYNNGNGERQADIARSMKLSPTTIHAIVHRKKGFSE